jgi:glycosyltransferase involved in cell wall biosynthesis
MNVWLIKDGENLPIQPDARRMRTWMLAEELQRQGHETTWWASTHSHQRKTLLFNTDREIDVACGFHLKLLFAGGYRSNRSFGRLLHHARLAAKFRRLAPTQPKPDVIVSAFPTIGLAFEAVVFARPRGIPVVIDIRDPWPDILLELVPPVLRVPARIALHPLERKARASFVGSDSLVACSHGFLDWGLRKAGMARRPADRVFYLGKSRPARDSSGDSAKIQDLRRILTGKVVFCFVGSFGHVYELDLICDAAASFEREGNGQIHFVLAGDGEQFGQVSARAKTLGNLTAMGWLSASDADRLLCVADVGLAPYRQMAGAMPNKVFDYSAAGLPILSSLEGEFAEKLAKHGAGVSYSPGDLNAFISHVKTLAASASTRQSMAQESTALFDREFLAASIYSDYVRHVESVARARAH